ncbi:HPr family phosphocarrier protein [Solwaraspora sp. WMMD1047]|uniref:HPr family phosphocarrier protein n=1 Tax=Solwaraspora sp. WMMD1047 TaxID=3016102 RepID=UPI002416863A|nr:HPr family phosphocarrier protein [Solwaraspora sp. WMMD1047]MDG4831355.1 HPr family phosphocarrier protein [Solwaraspora sp. WMMD1047]
MPTRTVTVGSASGLHARPAALFVAAAAAQSVPVTIRTGDRPAVPARSMLSVLALGARQGTEVVLAADGDGADAALDELAALLARDLDAEDATDTPTAQGEPADA